MRAFKTVLLAIAGLCLMTMPALAGGLPPVTVTMTSDYQQGTSLDIDDEVIVDLALDTPIGLQLLSVGVLYDLADELTYDGAATAALPPQGAGTSGAQPSYVLYSPPSGMAAGMMPATILYPVVTPYFRNWNGSLPPGQDQVNIDFAESGFNPAAASGAGVYIATLLFRVTDLGDGTNTIELCSSCGGNVVRVNDVEYDQGSINLSAPIVVTVPEPAGLGLAAAALGALALAAVRRRG